MTGNDTNWRAAADKSLEAMYQRALAAEAEVERLRVCLENALNMRDLADEKAERLRTAPIFDQQPKS